MRRAKAGSPDANATKGRMLQICNVKSGQEGALRKTARQPYSTDHGLHPVLSCADMETEKAQAQ